MRKIIVTIATLALIGSFSAAYAMSVGAGGGLRIGMPLGDLADSFKLNFTNFGGGVVIGVMPMLSIEGGFDYHLGYKNKAVSEGGITIEEGAYKLQMINFGGGARINFIKEGKFRPYAGGGLGFYLIKYKVVTEGTIVPEDVNSLGINFGGGINLFLNDKLAVNIPVKFNYILKTEKVAEGETASKGMLLTFGGGIEYFFM